MRLTQVGLFLTGIPAGGRHAVYSALEAVRKHLDFTIPFVHAVATMKEDEFRYLKCEFGTQRFNLHPEWEFPLEHPLSREIRRDIFIENSDISAPLLESDIEGFAGICFDLSHLEDARRSMPENFDALLDIATRFPVGANHISAVSPVPVSTIDGIRFYSKHIASAHSELVYLSQLPKMAFAELCAVELENSLREQLALIETIKAAIEPVIENGVPIESAVVE